mmetsp:Transcript_6850/g.22194  ORF Transcript_6850/g.22194 Transcript_6850/m.22194 type:complete len:361 (-) Transcript_6850:287-1369(-)
MNWSINKKELHLREEIGRGSFGVVRRAEWRHTQVAVKVLFDDAQGDDRELFEREVKIMATLHHPNIVQFLGYSRTPDLTLVIELFPEGSVEQFVPREKPNHKLSIRICLDMALAIEYLHSRQPSIIIHRDIKPANFLLTASRRVKLGDFGIARAPKQSKSLGNQFVYGSVGSLDLQVSVNSSPEVATPSRKRLEGKAGDGESPLNSPGGTPTASPSPATGRKAWPSDDPRCVTQPPMEFTSNCGTARYMAPEVAAMDGSKNRVYTCKADIFSMAMVYYFVLERTPPAIPGHGTPALYLEALNSGKRPAFHRTPKPLRALIDSMWHISAAERPDASEILDYLVGLRCTASMMGDGKVSFAS